MVHFQFLHLLPLAALILHMKYIAVHSADTHPIIDDQVIYTESTAVHKSTTHLNGIGRRTNKAIVHAIANYTRYNIGSSKKKAPYAPTYVTCPGGGPNSNYSGSYIRRSMNGGSISRNESSYVSAHQDTKSAALRKFLQGANLTDGYSRYLDNDTLRPTTAIMFSGGGYRAMLNGAGIFNTLDQRTSQSGAFGGLLQGMDYMVGLSGGAWLVGAIALAGFATIQTLMDKVWHLNDGLLSGEGVSGKLENIRDIQDMVDDKKQAGFETTITDYWGLTLGRQLVNRTDGGPDVLWSGIQDSENFRNHSMPFPILVADGLDGKRQIPATNSTIYEFNPFEFGSWDFYGDGGSFFPMELLGTEVNDGIPVDYEKCVNGFDAGIFVMGTSSNIFNVVLKETEPQEVEIDGPVGDLLEEVLDKNEDYASYPNPFYSSSSNKTNSNPITSKRHLSLVDGGEDNQNIPLLPLLQPSRALDFILAIDSSADTSFNYPDGSSLIATYESIYSGSTYTETGPTFPFIPDTTTFLALGLNKNPTFFGCNGSNYTSPSSSSISTDTSSSVFSKSSLSLVPPPLVVYIPNAPWSWYTNTSSLQLKYSDTEVSGFLDNGEMQITQGFSDKWRTCLACAVIQRSKERAGDKVGEQCGSCFEKYCWNGTVVGGSDGNKEYSPSLRDGSGESWEEQRERSRSRS